MWQKLAGAVAPALELIARALRARTIVTLLAYALVRFVLTPIAAVAIADPLAEALLTFVEWLLLTLAGYFRMVARGPIIQPPEGGPRPAQ